MSKASTEALSLLHAELATALKASLYNEDGSINTAAASVARQFLKDNFISADAGAKGSALGNLAAMPDFDEDGNVVPLRKAG
jgi:hypothetical protein